MLTSFFGKPNFIQEHKNSVHGLDFKYCIIFLKFQMGINPVGEKIIEGFLPPRRMDTNRTEHRISFTQFTKTFAVFRPIHKNEINNFDAPNSKKNKVKDSRLFFFSKISV